MIRKILKHIQRGTFIPAIINRLKAMIGKKSGYDQYYGEAADEYLSRRMKQERWLIEQEIVADLVSKMPNCLTVLDVPFGTGRFVDLYLQKSMSVYGIDISEDMLAAAKKVLGNKYYQCNLKVGNAVSIPYENDLFDLVVSCRFFTLIPLDMSKKVLSEMSRVTKSFLILNIRVGRGILPILNRKIDKIICLLFGTPGWQKSKKIDGFIDEKYLYEIFEELGLNVQERRIIQESTAKVNAFYILKK